MVWLKLIVLFLAILSLSEGRAFFPIDPENDEGFSVAVASKRYRSTTPVPYPSRFKGKNNHALVGQKDSLFDDKYKPWGSASTPSLGNLVAENVVILDKVDDDLFAPTSEIHKYDQSSHEETRYKLML